MSPSENEGIHEDKAIKIKDKAPNHTLNKLLYGVKAASRALLEELEHLEEFAGNYHWLWSNGETISVYEIQERLKLIALFPSPIVPECNGPTKSRPVEVWKKTARSVADLIQNTLLKSGFNKKPSGKYREGPVAIIGAAAINWAYNKNISERSFADALKRRDRRKKGAPKDYYERFPDAARLK
jgi:hypothetical protein